MPHSQKVLHIFLARYICLWSEIRRTRKELIYIAQNRFGGSERLMQLIQSLKEVDC